MIAHVPEDMTVTVAAGVTLGELQARLAERGQWLPVDPPEPGRLTIRTLLDTNASGPRRFGYGTIREHLLGLRVTLPKGQTIRAGGQVVKNVAGYDLCKLFIGAGGALGRIEEATFKLRPVPETERFVQRRCPTLAEAGPLIEWVLDSELIPVVLDLVAPATAVVGLAGAREDVEWQCQQLGWNEPATLDHNRAFPQTFSVLPSKLVETIAAMKPADFVARAGNGIIHCGGTGQRVLRSGLLRRVAMPVLLCAELDRRVKEAFGG